MKLKQKLNKSEIYHFLVNGLYIQTEGNGFFMTLEKVVVTVARGDKQLEKFVADYPNIRTLKGFLAGEWDLSVYDSCFKGANRLGDVDASIELAGHTLLIEFKSAKGGMNKGQVLKAIRQAKYTGIMTIFVFGKRNAPEAYLKISPDDSEAGFRNSGYVLADADMVHDQFTRWAGWAEQNSLVQSKTDEWAHVTEILSSVYNA